MAGFVVYPHAALERKAVARAVDARMVQAGAELLAAAEAAQAYGLAAAHLGLDVVISVAASGARDYRVLYNPEILALADELVPGMEGSVSFPGIEAPVSRAVWVDVGFDDGNGQRRTSRFEGFVARVAQHEIDQMNGVFFLQRLSRLKRDTALRKYAKLSQQG
jgi:peptide deformylase